MEWEDMLTLMRILDKYGISYECGDYYDYDGKVTAHWLDVDLFVDSEEI